MTVLAYFLILFSHLQGWRMQLLTCIYWEMAKAIYVQYNLAKGESMLNAKRGIFFTIEMGKKVI